MLFTKWNGSSWRQPICESIWKTGSAQYDSTKNYHAWFCGYGTNDVSEIAVCVMIEKGGAGGIVAAPVAGQIFDYYFSR